MLILSAVCILTLVFVGTACAGMWYWFNANPSPTSRNLTLSQLFKLPPDQLDKVDVGQMDLLCATGLRGSENLDIPTSLHTLDEWAAKVKADVDANLYKFNQYPGVFRHSVAFFKAQDLVTVLDLDLGCHYDQDRSNDEPNATFFASSGPVFIHGLLGSRHAGTCSSIPVLVVAISQRLGWPVKLVCNSNHFFARWDDGKDRFNIEASNEGGMGSHPDAYYRYWPRPLTDAEIAREGYLQSMDGRHELAALLGKRIMCLEVNGQKDEAKMICQKMQQLVPSTQLAELTGGQ